LTQGFRGVIHVEEHEPTYGGIEEPARIGRPRVGLTELDVRASLRRSALTGELEGLSVEIDPDDRSLRTN
jgi:hypothetical protein